MRVETCPYWLLFAVTKLGSQVVESSTNELDNYSLSGARSTYPWRHRFKPGRLDILFCSLRRGGD